MYQLINNFFVSDSFFVVGFQWSLIECRIIFISFINELSSFDQVYFN